MTPETFVSPVQIGILAVFLSGLLLMWLFVQRNREGLAKRINQGRRIKVAEVTAISPVDRAILLTIDDREFLVLRSKGVAPVLTELSAGGQK